MIRQVANASGFGMPPMSWEGIDHALNRVRGEVDRISLNLADLDRHTVYRLLRGAELNGGTRGRWEVADVHAHRLWPTHAAFESVVEHAARLRESGVADSQAELTRLLMGESVTLPLAEVPLRERGLLDPGTENITLAEAIARMTADYEAITEVVSAVETAWDALHPRLDELDAMWREVGTLADMVEVPDDEYEDLRAELERVGNTVRRDPLSLVADGGVDTLDLDRMRSILDRTRGELRDALRMRDAYDESVSRLDSAIDDVEKVVLRSRDLRVRVVAKISSPAAIDVPDPVPELRAAIAEMDELRSRRRWRALGARLGELQRSVHESGDDARDRERNLGGLLQRRAELRGRLDAFRARAVRLGLAEHERLVEPHGRAHWELWKAPCDLRAATVALSAYQRALQELVGTETPSVGTQDGGVNR